MPKVLVLDCWTRKTLSAVRSLGREKVTVEAVSHTRIAPGLYSSFTKKYYIAPDPKKSPVQYLERILDLLRKGNYDCIMPFEESSIEILLGARHQVEKLTRLPVAFPESYHQANNKWEVLKLAVKNNVPAPVSFSPANETELTEAAKQLGFPLIIKPVNSSGSRGLKKVMHPAQLYKAFNEVSQLYGQAVVQEYIEQTGEGCGVGVLASGGEILTSFSYRRLREFPVTGGPSTLRESTNDNELKEYAAKLIRELRWDGIAMVEFKRNPATGKPLLMEVNPRFWGSLDLSFVSGVNFPFLLLKHALGEKIEQINYKPGIRCRWLLPGDIAHFIANPQRFSLEPSFFKFFDKKTYYDDFKKWDMKGSIAVIACTIAMVFDPEIWKIGVFRK